MVEGWEPRDNGEGMSVLGVIRPVAEGGEHIHDCELLGQRNHGASERVPFFFGFYMQDIWSVRFTCLLVCRYDNFGGKVSIGAEEYLSRINIKVYEGDENGNLVFEGGAAECLAWADGYCGDC